MGESRWDIKEENSMTLTITAVSGPVYSKADNSTIDVQATFSDGRVLPYTAAAFDNTDYGIQLWSDLNTGKYGAISAYVAPPSS